MIPFLDLRAGYIELKEEIHDAVLSQLDSGVYILGAEVELFESEFAKFCGTEHCVAVGNGLDALILSLKSLDIGPGDEVIVPSNTYIATWLAVSVVGATPVPVDPILSSYCIDPARVEAAITSRTRAVLPVHLYGQPADMVSLSEICFRKGLYLISDAAQAHGASIGNSSVGQLGDIVAWSFYPSKNLGAFGDAGAITTKNKSIADRLRTLRNYGSTIKYYNQEKGLNSRLDPIQAAVLRIKLRHLLEWNARRERIAQHYISHLSDLPIALPALCNGSTHAWHVFVVATPQRDNLQRFLTGIGIGTIIHYPVPPFRQNAYLEFSGRAQEWPYADQISSEVLSLPIGPHLSFSDTNFVIDSIRTFFEK